ncbi:signal peptidase I [Bacillus sp. B1-b2]|uniref:signal peptidase I n=1 Tax=Bacillus sp. B1-b2 TaxID=2653201 RepID=UPI00126283BA|nr:signal peptidase I [Bacillus sp. B1-b2]KAB7665381.1 signal peptidase I [Bacillus sp. B1-b2]
MREAIKKESIEWLKAFGIGIIIFIIIRAFLFSNYVVDGESMLPTLQDGNKLIVNKLGYRMTGFEHFDVIVFHANEKEDYVKRVIGVPGDKIEYRDDQLYINGNRYEEPFLNFYRNQVSSGRLTGNFTLEELTGEKIVPKGKLFVLGDNRLGSWDSRHFGFIPIEDVVGKVNLRYWPFNEIQYSF